LIGPGSSGLSPSIVQSGNNIYLVINCGGARVSRDSGETWQFANKGFDYQKFGSDADDMQVIEPHPKIKDLVFAGGKTGVYRSTDNALTWSRVLSGEEAKIGDIAFNPLNNNIIYAATGRLDANEPYNNVAKSEGIIWRSDDKGLTWIEAGKIENANIYSLAISPENKIYAATNTGLWKSLDNGKSWQKLSGLPHDRPVTVKLDRFDPKTIYVVLLTNPQNKGGVWKSIDEGETWRDITSNLISPRIIRPGKEVYNVIQYKDFEQHPTDNNTIFITSLYIKGGGIWVSRNNGSSWESLTTEENMAEGWADNKQFFGIDLSINEYNPLEMVFTSGGESNGFKTIDGGKTWVPLHTKKTGVVQGKNTYSNKGMESYKGAIAVHPDNTGIILLGYGDHGIFKSVDGGKNFFRVADKASDANFIRFSIADPNKVYMVSWQPEKNMWISNDAGSTWELRNQDNMEMLDVLPHPRKKDIAFAVSNKGLLKTENGGDTWKAIEIPDAKNIKSISFMNNKLLFAAGGKEVYMSSNDGSTWLLAYKFDASVRIYSVFSPKSNIFVATDDGVYKSEVTNEKINEWFLVLPEKGMTIVNGGGDFVYSASFNGNGIWMSRLNGNSGTWTQITGEWSGDIEHMTADPKNPNIVYASGKCAGVWKRVN